MKRFLAFLLLLTAVVYSQTREVPKLGSTSNDGTGDSLRSFGHKVANNESNLFKAIFTNGPAARVVDSVADLVAFTGFDGLAVATLGYYTPGDGGGGPYRWTNALPSGVTAGSTFYIAGSSGYWALQHGGRVDIRQTGFTGDGSAPDTALLQDALDYAPDGTEFVVPDGTFDVTYGLRIRRHNISLVGNGTLRAAEDLFIGTLINIVNATNVTVRDINIDVAGNYDNGLTVVGMTDGLGEYTSLVGSNYCQNITIDGVRVSGARFHVNMVEALDLTAPPAFTPGNELWQLSNERRLRAVVLTNDVANSRVTVRYLDSRFSIGPGVEEFASGVPTGEVRVVSGRTNVPQEAPNGATYSSLQGLFGGKGISIQYGVRGVVVSNFQTEDCDVGVSVEGNSDAGRENQATVIHGGIIRNSGRTGIWLLNSGSTVESQSVFGPTITSTRIINWGHAWSGFGAISSDRAVFANISDVTANIEPDYVPYGPVTIWQGTVAHSKIQIAADLPEASRLVDFRKHSGWGNSPGSLINGSINNEIDIKALVGTLTDNVLWTNSVATNQVYYYAVDWDTDPASGLAMSDVLIQVAGWTNAQWIGKSRSTVRYEIHDRSNNNSLAVGSAQSPVEFGESFRIAFNGVGTVGDRAAVKFNDRIDVESKVSLAGGSAEWVWDTAGGFPYIRAVSGTMRLRNTSNEDVALLTAGRFQTASSAYNGKNFGMGSYVYWMNGNTMYTKNGTPSSAADGTPVVLHSVDTLADLVAVGTAGRTWVRTLGYYAAGDGGGAVYRWASGYSGTTNALGGALSVSGGAWVQIGETFDVRQFGATAGDDSDDDQPNIEAAFNFMPAGSTLRITGGTYDLGQRISLNTKNDWVLDGEGGTVKIKNPITTASVTVMDIYAVTNARIFGLTVDGNGWTGINGIGIGGKTNSNARNIMVDSVLVKSVTRSPAADLGNDIYGGGGRGITAQFNCYNILVTGCTVLDSTSGYDVHGNSSDPIGGISFVNNVAENCEEGASFYDLLDGNGSPDNVSGSQVMVSGLTMLNCGLSTSGLEFGQWPTGTQGGAIVFIRSRGIQMDGIKLWNNPGYGVIGAVLRGTGKYVNVSDIDARADVVSAVWLYKAENTRPLNSTTDNLIVPDSFVVSNFRFTGTSTNLIRVDQPTEPAVQNSRFEIISDADVESFVAGSGSLTTGGNSTVLRAFRRTDSRRVDATLNQIVALANDWSTVPIGGLLQQASFQSQLTILQTNSTPTLRLKRMGTLSGEVRVGVVGAELRVYDSGGSTYPMAIATTGGGTVIEPTGVSGAVAASAVLDLRSTSKGFLPPRMTTAQKNAISSPADGLVVFDTNLGRVAVDDGAVWQTLGQPTTSTLTTSSGDVTVTGGNRATYSHYWAADGDADLVFSSVVDGDTGTLLVWAASTNVTLTLTDAFAYSPSGSTLTVTGGTNNWSVVAWEARTINSNNVVLVNLGDYSR